MPPQRPAELPDFVDNFSRLLETFRWRDQGTGVILGFTTPTLGAALRELGYEYSDGYLMQLRTGAKANPSAVLIAGLSRVFDVDVRYWFDAEVAARTRLDLDRKRDRLEKR